MDDEFGAEHFDIRIGVVTIVFEAGRTVVLVAWAVERVAGAVRADEALAAGDGI